MRKVKRTPSSVTVILLFLLLSVSMALAADIDREGQLLALRIEYSDYDSLAEMAMARGLALGTIDEMRSALLAYHQLSVQRIEDRPARTGGVELTIDEASSIESPSSSLFIIEGGVHLSLKTDSEARQRLIAADRIIIDLDHNRLSAYGSVRYEDDGQVGKVEAAFLSYAWEAGDLEIIDALMASEHDKNEKKGALTLYSRAETVTSISLGTVTTYHDGAIATRSDDPLSSIKAKKMVFRPGGDLLVTGATVKIGRVPLFWVPFFPFINNRMVGNPAVGINSERGMFVSTTWEVFGSYPKIGEAGKSEAVALLAKTERGPLYPGPVIYSKQHEPTPLDRWADSTDSYLAITADAYEYSGVAIGFDTSLSLLSNRLKISALSLFALDPLGEALRKNYGDVPPLRYLFEPVLSYASPTTKVRLNLPLYSDPSVKSLYANRLNAFAIEGPLGKAMEFPSDYTGDITRTEWRLNASVTVPTTHTRPYLSSLTIPTLNAQIRHQYKKDSDTGQYGWQITNIVLPELTIRAAGSPLSLKRTVGGRGTAPAASTSSTGVEVPSDPLLTPFYKTATESAKRTVTPAYQELGLSYTIEQRLNQRLEPEGGQQEYLYSFSKANLRLYATPHSTFLTISEELVPQLSIVEDTNKKTFYNQEGQIFLTSKVAIPLIGLEYQLSHRLARLQITEDENGRQTSSEGWAFSEEQVTVHRLSLAKSFPLLGGTARPSITLDLPPLKQSLSPLLAWSGGPITLSASATFIETGGSLEAERIKATLKYTNQRFTFFVEPTYLLDVQGGQWHEGLSIKQGASYQSPSKFLKLSQGLTYEGLSKTGTVHAIDALTFTAEIPHLMLHWAVHGPIDALTSKEFKGSISLLDQQLRFYKRRIALFWGLNTSLYFHFEDPYASALEFEARLGLSIAELLDVKLSIKSTNNGFYRYYDGDDFVFGRLWEDLVRSFDFGGSGRTNTQFNLNAITFELVHDLGDWSLNCQYNASVVLSNNQYRWVPTVSVFLSWKVLNELDIDERWTQTNGTWVRLGTT